MVTIYITEDAKAGRAANGDFGTEFVVVGKTQSWTHKFLTSPAILNMPVLVKNSILDTQVLNPANLLKYLAPASWNEVSRSE